MNPKRLLQHFNEIAEAPDAVPRLRRFILELAVRGKLVEQNPNDESAADLLKRIEANRTRLVEAEGIRNTKLIATTQADNAPFEIPKTWKWVHIEDIAYVEMGQSPSSEFYNQNHEGLPFFQGKADFGRIYPTPRYWCTAPTKLAEKGDILISVRAPVGPTNVATERCCIGRGLAALRPFQGYERDFLLLGLKRSERDLEALGAGTTFIAINRKHLLTFLLPLPPLAEQHRIVEMVDELMALCDELEAAQQKRERRRERLVAATLNGLNNGDASSETHEPPAFEESARFYFNHLPRLTTRPEHIQQLRQTILNLAVRGKLVPQDPSDEPATKLLSRVEAEKAFLVKAGELRKQIPVPPINEEEIPFAVPANWQWVRLIDVLTKLTDGTHHSPPNLNRGDFRYVTAKNIKPEAVSLDDITFVTAEVHHEIYSRCNPEKGDILYIKDGATTGIVTVNNLDEPYSMLSSVALLKVPRAIYNLLLVFFLRSPFFYDQMRGFMKGAAITRVTLKRMAPALIPIPPYSEQHRIVAKVEELMALCDELEAKLNITLTTRRQFLEATLSEAIAPS